MNLADLVVASTISNYPVAESIIVNASRECVLNGVFILKEPTKSTQTMTQESDSAIFGDTIPYFLRFFFVSRHTLTSGT
jgi:hypothetical protein